MNRKVSGEAPFDDPAVPALSEDRRKELRALAELHRRQEAAADALAAQGIDPTPEAIDAALAADDLVVDERRRAHEWFAALAHACIDQPTILNHPLRERALKLFREQTRSTPLNATRAAHLLRAMLVRTARVPGSDKRRDVAPMPLRPWTTSSIADQLRLWFGVVVRPADIDAAWEGKEIKIGRGKPRANQIALGVAIFRVLRLANLTRSDSADVFERTSARLDRKKKGRRNRP